MLVLPLSWGAISGYVWPKDDRGGPDVPGTPETTNLLPGVHVGPHCWFLGDNHQPQYGVDRGDQVPPHLPPDEDRLYWFSFLWTATMISWTVEGCQRRAASRTKLRVHFVHPHVWVTIVILEEVNLHCPRCDMFVLWGALNSRYPNMAICSRNEERKVQRLAAEEAQSGSEI